MTRTVIKRGHADWDDLIGRDISFGWSDGWEDYTERLVFSHTEAYATDPRYPRYYVLAEDDGGASVWEDEDVEVTVYDREGVD